MRSRGLGPGGSLSRKPAISLKWNKMGPMLLLASTGNCIWLSIGIEIILDDLERLLRALL